MSQVPGHPAAEGVETRAQARIDGHLEKVQLVFQPWPKYPPEAKKAGVRGRVRLEALVRKNGSIKKLKVLSGHPLLVKAATEAVSQWRFKPTVLAGEPVEVETEIDVIFKLPTQRQ